MKLSETPTNSFYSFDNLQIFTTKNNVRFLALAGHPIKRGDSMPIDVNVVESSKERFLEELKKASTKEAMSHLYQEILTKQLI